jgi:ABC-type branched-subunit amino acid transport system ATPase component
MAPRAIWRLGVGRTFQITATFSSMTVVENVQMALISRERRIFHLWQAAGCQLTTARKPWQLLAGRHGKHRL